MTESWIIADCETNMLLTYCQNNDTEKALSKINKPKEPEDNMRYAERKTARMVTNGLNNHLINSNILNNIFHSDHCPISVEFDI